MENTNREKLPEGLFQSNALVKTIHDKKQPYGDGNCIYKNLKQKFMVDFKIPGSIKREITQSDDSGQVEYMQNDKPDQAKPEFPGP